MITYLPLGLLAALMGWAVTALVSAPLGASAFAIALLVGAAALGVISALRVMSYADLGALFLVAATFIGAAVFFAPVGLVELYAFVGVSIFAAQVTRFRTMVRPFLQTADRADREALRSLYVSFLQRLGFLVVLVVLVSLILYAAAIATTFDLTSEVTAFALGLAILLAFVLIARLRT